MVMESSNAGSAGSVLVVDDEPGVRLLLEHALTRFGYEVIAVDGAEAALPELARRRFDLLLTDKNMPGMDGVQLAQQAHQRYPELCIVMVSGFASAESARQTQGVVDAYLTKPFSVMDLKNRLTALLERRRARNAAASTPKDSPAPLSGLTLLFPPTHERLSIESAAQQAGIQLGFASDASAIADLPPGAVLLVDGRYCTTEVYRAIWQRQAKDHGFRVVLVTSPDDPHAEINAVSLGARAHLTLPVSAQALLDTLRQHRDGSRA